MGDEERRKEESSDLFHVLESEHGRRFIRRLLADCGVFGSVAKSNGLALKEEHAVWYRAGKQDFGHSLMAACMDSNPVAYQKMHTEGYERKLREEIERRPKGKGNQDVQVASESGS